MGMPETSYEGSALFTCLLAANRAGVRNLHAAIEGLCTRRKSFEQGANSKLPHQQQLPRSKQTSQAGSDRYQTVTVTALCWLGMQDKQRGKPKRANLDGDLTRHMHHASLNACKDCKGFSLRTLAQAAGVQRSRHHT